VCRPEPLTGLFEQAGLGNVTVRSIDTPTIFKDFDDYWTPFLGGQAPAPGYCIHFRRNAVLPCATALKRAFLLTRMAPSILIARAWAVRGAVL
jgi:hypothetical protein